MCVFRVVGSVWEVHSGIAAGLHKVNMRVLVEPRDHYCYAQLWHYGLF